MPIKEQDGLGASLQQLLARSNELDRALTGLLEASYPDERLRIRTARTLCTVSFEHGDSARSLIALGNFTSAMALIRLQYEALVRGMWIHYGGATEEWVAKLAADLTDESARRANSLPSLKEMLDSLNGRCDEVALSMLLEFKEYSWRPLSSFVHGGIHALHRKDRGYPVVLLEQAVRHSNGVAGMVGMLVVLLSANPALKGVIPSIQHEFADCCPALRSGGDT